MPSWLKTAHVLITAAMKYGPLIAAVIRFIHLEKANEKRRTNATLLERAFHLATETDDLSDFEKTVREIRASGPGGSGGLL